MSVVISWVQVSAEKPGSKQISVDSGNLSVSKSSPVETLTNVGRKKKGRGNRKARSRF